MLLAHLKAIPHGILIVMTPLDSSRPSCGSSILLVSWVETLRIILHFPYSLFPHALKSSFTVLFIYNLSLRYQCTILSHLPRVFLYFVYQQQVNLHINTSLMSSFQESQASINLILSSFQ